MTLLLKLLMNTMSVNSQNGINIIYSILIE